MNKKQLAEAMQLLKRIEKTKKQIGTLRDSLRRDVSEIKEILNSIDYASEDIETGCRYLNDGLAELSSYL